MEIKAVIHLTDGDKDTINYLKRTVLAFDKIDFILPSLTLIRKKSMSDTSKFKRNKDGTIEVSKFDILDDTHQPMELVLRSLPNQELKELLIALVESGIASKAESDSGSKWIEFEKNRNNIARNDLFDAEFCELMNFKMDEFNPFEKAGILPFQPIDKKYQLKENQIYYMYGIDMPTPILRSYEISTLCHTANNIGSFPIFNNPIHRKLLNLKFQKFNKNIEEIKSKYPKAVPYDDFRLSFAETTFSFLNYFISDYELEQISIEDILKFRNELGESRQRLVSTNLMELNEIISKDPWSNNVKSKVQKYVDGKIRIDLLKYENDCKEIWTKFKSTIPVSVTNVLSATMIGGSSGLLGTVIPNSSFWGMLLLGSSLGFAKESPKVVKSLIEAHHESKKLKKSSLNFISSIKKLNKQK